MFNETIRWYQSKIILAQIVAALFALAVILGFDPVVFGLEQEQVVAAVMAIIAIFTTIRRAKTNREVVSAAAHKAGLEPVGRGPLNRR